MKQQLKLIQSAVRRAAIDAERAYWRLKNIDAETLHALGQADNVAKALDRLDKADTLISELDVDITAAIAKPCKQ